MFVVIGVYQKVSFTRVVFVVIEVLPEGLFHQNGAFTRMVFVVIGVLPEGLFHYNGVCSDWGLTRRSLSL